MKFPFVRLFCGDAGPASNPSLATRNLLRIPYILYSISYLLIISPTHADDEGLSDYISAIEPRAGTTVKTGSAAFRGRSMIVTTGSNYYEGRDHWLNTGSMWYGPEGRTVMKVGNQFFREDGTTVLKVGNYYYRPDGFSMDLDTITIDTPDE